MRRARDDRRVMLRRLCMTAPFYRNLALIRSPRGGINRAGKARASASATNKN